MFSQGFEEVVYSSLGLENKYKQAFKNEGKVNMKKTITLLTHSWCLSCPAFKTTEILRCNTRKPSLSCFVNSCFHFSFKFENYMYTPHKGHYFKDFLPKDYWSFECVTFQIQVLKFVNLLPKFFCIKQQDTWDLLWNVLAKKDRWRTVLGYR